MKQAYWIFLILALSCGPISAQVKQSGDITPGHVPVWIDSGVIGDGGTAADGFLTSLGVTASGPGICQSSGAFGGAYNQLCFAPTITGGGFTFTSYGGATGTPTFNVNGTVYTFPFTTSGAVGPGTSTVGHIATWNNTIGTLLADSGGPPAQTIASVAHQFLTSYTSSTGAFTQVQPACGDLSNSGSGCQAAAGNPTATAGPVAINGVSSNYLRADAAPAVQKGSSAQFGIMECDNVTITCSGGVLSALTGTINSQAGNYTIQSTDCNGIVVMTGAFKTLSWPSSFVGFPSSCPVRIVNGSATRAQALSGFPTVLPPGCGGACLWPSQGATFQVAATGYVLQFPWRWDLQTSQELCVEQDGSDNNDGLGSGATGCLQTISHAVFLIGDQWDGGGYNACSIGLHAGGTNTFSETASQTGQSIGCYLTFNIYDNLTWGATNSCLSTGDNAIAVINITTGKTLTLQCNTSNTATLAAFYGHQEVILDINGPGTYKWIPGGSNDNFLFLDGQGRATLNAPFILGDGTTKSGNTFITCDQHCSGVGVSGNITTAANMTLSRMYALYAGSFINLGATYTTTGTVTNASLSSGNSVLTTNGTSVPTSTTTTGTGGAGIVCTTKC